MTYNKIKSLYYATSAAQIYPSPSSVTLPRCQTGFFTVNFSNVQYSNQYESPALVYGSITSYEYLLPNGWTLGTTSPIASNGSNWIAGTNSATINYDATNGVGGTILIRAKNSSCTAGAVGTQYGVISISRPEPNLTITGSQDYICTGSTSFTVNNVPSTASIQWALSNTIDATIVGCSTCATVNVARQTTTNRVVTLTATVTDCGFTYTRTQNITLGTGISTVSFTQKDASCLNSRHYFYGAVAPVPSATNYDWYAKDESNANNPFVLKQSEKSATADFPLSTGKTAKYYTIRVIATNICGTVQTIDAEGYMYFPACSSSSRIAASKLTKVTELAIFPNPVHNTLSITIPSDSMNISYTFIRISDLQGKLIKKVAVVNERNTIDISSIVNGVYVVEIADDKRRIVKKIVKN